MLIGIDNVKRVAYTRCTWALFDSLRGWEIVQGGNMMRLSASQIHDAMIHVETSLLVCFD